MQALPHAPPVTIPDPSHPPFRGLLHDTGSGAVGMFVHGFRSHGSGLKAMATARHAHARGWSWLRFELHAHGAEPTPFAGFRLSRALREVEAAMDLLQPRPAVLVGSSMGGWLAWLAALRRPRRVAGLVLIAPAVRLPEYLLGRLDDAAAREWRARGRHRFADAWSGDSYELDHAFLADAVALQQMARTATRPDRHRIPVRLLHGACDEVVPVADSLALAAGDFPVEVIPGEGHRLEGATDRIRAALDAVWPESGRME